MDVERLRTRLAPFVVVALSGCTSVFGPTTATSFMRQVETSPDPNVRFKAYKSLGSAKVYDDLQQKAAATKLLLENLDPRKEPLASRAVICRTLGELGDPSARDAMARLVRDPDPMIRAEAYRALGKVGRREDATLLMQAMALDQDDHCRVAAIEALGSLKDVDPRTEPYLVRRLDREVEDPRIRYAALKSLRKISGKDFGANPEPWRGYVLAKYGEKVDPSPVVVAGGGPTVDRSASPASLTGSARPPGAPGAPGDPIDAWNRVNADTGETDAPYLSAARPAANPSSPGQPATPAPPSTPRSVFSKIFGY